MLAAKGIELLHQQFPHSRRILDKIFIVQDAERGKAARHGQIIASERAGMDNSSIEPAENLVVNRTPGNNGAARNKTSAQAFSNGHDVRLKIPMFEPPDLSRTSKSGLHFVAYNDCSMSM